MTFNDTTQVTMITDLPTTTAPKVVSAESLLRKLLSMKKYDKICGYNKATEPNIQVDTLLFKTNEIVDCYIQSFLFLAVLSHISNYESREKIRQSWGSIRQLKNKKLTVIFFVFSDKSISTKERKTLEIEQIDYLDTVWIEEKQNIHTDVDIYLKIFHFAIFGCHKPEYFVFVNDAMFVNIPTLFEAILTSKDINKPSQFKKSLMLCNVKKKSLAVRNRKSPWYVTFQEWASVLYPPYCDILAGIVISGDLVRDLLMCSLFAQKFWITDVYLTGILPQKLNVVVENFLEDFSTKSMKNHYIESNINNKVFLTNGQGYNINTWRLIFNRSLREL